MIKSLIQEGCDFNAVDKNASTVMYDAITEGFQDIVLELCVANANIKNQDNDGKTPFHFASIHSQLEIAGILFKYNADVNLKDENGNYPIFDSIFNSKKIIIFFL
ncbi:ankyrin repeat domain-containing protein [Sphingobacterium sp. HJSM2_6]|uniref:ankyrin repeat domain-containing protein n=1 Tax=Sphingobacterium sp. HJSM2_6 TaxID=3366264 RepID=UPI003BC5274A